MTRVYYGEREPEGGWKEIGYLSLEGFDLVPEPQESGPVLDVEEMTKWFNRTFSIQMTDGQIELLRRWFPPRVCLNKHKPIFGVVEDSTPVWKETVNEPKSSTIWTRALWKRTPRRSLSKY